MIRSRVQVLAAALAVAAMGADGSTAGAQAVAPPSALAAPAASLTQEMRIDGAAESLGIVDPSFLLVAKDGRVVVWQPQDLQIRFYDAAAKRLASFGRRGSGPGEFVSRYVSAGWVGDTLWAFDMYANRLTLIGPNGTLHRTISVPQFVEAPTPGGTSVTRFRPTALLADGGMVGSARVGSSGARGGDSTTFAYIRLSRRGELQQVLGTPPAREALISAQPSPARAGMPAGISGRVSSVPYSVPGSADRSTSADGQRLAFLSTVADARGAGKIALTVLNANGDTILARSYAFRANPVSAADRERAIAAQRPELQDEARKQIGTFYPPLTTVVLGRDNTIWFQLRGTSDGTPCVMLNGRGEPVLTVMLPRGADLFEASSQHVWTIEKDIDDVPSILRYKVTTGGR